MQWLFMRICYASSASLCSYSAYVATLLHMCCRCTASLSAWVIALLRMCLKRQAYVTHTLSTDTHDFEGKSWICSASLSPCLAHVLKGPPADVNTCRDRGPYQRDGAARGLLGRACSAAPPRRPTLPAPRHPRAAADAAARVCGRCRARPPPVLPPHRIYRLSMYIIYIDSIYI